MSLGNISGYDDVIKLPEGDLWSFATQFLRKDRLRSFWWSSKFDLLSNWSVIEASRMIEWL